MIQTIKLEKIIHKNDICGKCSVCGKDLKKVYVTNQGEMGMDCFLEAIGLPRIRSTTKKSPILPKEQYNSLASHLIEKLKQLSNAEWKQAFEHEYGTDAIHELKMATFRFKLRFKNGRLEDGNVLILHKHLIAAIGQLPLDMMDAIMESESYNQAFFASQKEIASIKIII